MVNQGLLEVNFNIKNNINLNNAFSSENVKNPLLKSISGNISAKDANSLENLAGGNTALQHIDTIRTNSSNTSLKEALNNLPNLKYVRLEGSYESKGNSFDNNTNLQKVDLSESLQVKPEDFKANENLKTLPNLDYSNPDLTDIITNDTNLLPTTFDISNESNTNKLGIHGDSTHQLENLEFVKVNPDAPFDNQITPQIDVSYTSLDKNGLVNLFNTMPYNVGYNVIGNPTITDGVVNGFSKNDYVRPTSMVTMSALQNIEFNIRFKTPIQFGPSFNCILGDSPTIFGVSIYSNIYLNVRLAYYNNTSYQISNIPYYAFSTDTWYKVKLVGNNGIWTVTLYNDDGEELISKSQDHTASVFSENYYADFINLTSDEAYSGSIDLNETYIKVNGIPWFTGKAAMTKTCNIKGCTGTADLTQEDKNIALDKGWELTVA